MRMWLWVVWSRRSWFSGVVVITSASHAEGPRFEPGLNQTLFHYISQYFTTDRSNTLTHYIPHPILLSSSHSHSLEHSQYSNRTKQITNQTHISIRTPLASNLLTIIQITRTQWQFPTHIHKFSLCIGHRSIHWFNTVSAHHHPIICAAQNYHHSYTTDTDIHYRPVDHNPLVIW